MSLLAVALALVPAAFALRAAIGSHAAAPARKRSFVIAGDLRVPLRPGSAQSLDLRLTNRRRVTLWVVRLRVRVTIDRVHRRAGCSARRDLVVWQLPRRAFPIRLPARAKRRLSRLGVGARPRIGMRDLARVNQDACKRARLRLRYTGTARSSRPRTTPSAP
jgi:hypothetical protein